MKALFTTAILAAAALLSGCADFRLGSMNYCAAGSECTNSIRPFRPAEAVPSASQGAASSVGLQVVR